MYSFHPFSFVLATVVLLLPGCSVSILHLRDQLDLHRASLRDRVAEKKELAQQFLVCTRQAYDEPPGGSQAEAETVVAGGREPNVLPLQALIERIRTLKRDKADLLTILPDVLGDLDHADRRIDLDKLKTVVEMIRRWHAHVDFDEDELAQDRSRFTRLLLAYNKAYFGDTSFKAESHPTTPGSRGVVKVTSTGFIDRNGNALAFPGISSEVQRSPDQPVHVYATGVDSRRVASDLVRLFLEAFFDAAFRVPAEQNATALQIAWGAQEKPYPKFDADRLPISLDDFSRVSRDALRAEAAVTSAIGQVVRGGTVFGTNNETLAAALETAGGVIAKKLAEHEGFCYYQVMQRTKPIADNGDSSNHGQVASIVIP